MKAQTNKSERGQVSKSAAQVYDEFFLPALFQQWATRVAGAARINTGQRVLDVACGTGVLACAIADRLGVEGSVVGIDLNEGMLDLARRKRPALEWRLGRAEDLPFAADSFDCVVSQFGLMFFEDQRVALNEMLRVLRPGGNLAIAVWDGLEPCPGLATHTDLLHSLFGDRAANALRVPFNLGDRQRLSLFAEAGFTNVSITTLTGTARFPSIRSWIQTDIKGWTLADMIDDVQYELLLKEAEKNLQSFLT